MADQVMQDQSMIDMSHKQFTSLAEILGADIDSSQYRSMANLGFYNDTLSISKAGQVVNDQAQSIIITPQIGNSILWLYTLGFGCQYKGATKLDVPINAPALFRPTSIKIANFTKSYANGEYYVQQQLELLNKSKLAPYNQGIWVGNVDQDGTLTISIANGADNAANLYANVSGNNMQTEAYLEGYQSVMQGYLKKSALRGDRNMFIPLWIEFYPLIQALGTLFFVKYAGQIQFQLQTVPYKQNIVKVNNYTGGHYVPDIPNASYELSNFVVFFHHDTLVNSPQILDAVLKSEIEYRPEYTLQSYAAYSSSVTLQFPASKNQRILQFSYGVHQTGRAANLINSQASLYAGNNQYSGGCILFPAIRVSQITINSTGQVMTINSQQLAQCQLIQPLETAGQNYPYLEGGSSDGAWKFLRCPMAFDFSRFGIEDMIGSSNGTVENIIITIYFDTSEDLSGYGKISTTTTTEINAIAVAPSSVNNSVYAFLTVSSKMVMKNGEYYEAQ